MKKLNYYTVDVLSVINNLPFDYVNSYVSLEEAKNEAEKLFKKDEVVRALVNKWIRKYDEQDNYIGEDIDWDFVPITYEMEGE